MQTALIYGTKDDTKIPTNIELLLDMLNSVDDIYYAEIEISPEQAEYILRGIVTQFIHHKLQQLAASEVKILKTEIDSLSESQLEKLKYRLNTTKEWINKLLLISKYFEYLEHKAEIMEYEVHWQMKQRIDAMQLAQINEDFIGIQQDVMNTIIQKLQAG